MTINERIRYLRKEVLHLNQRQFATDLGMAQTGISSAERNGATITDRFIKSISSVYNVNEEWLRTGEGEIFVKPETFSLDQFVKERGASELELEFLKVYFELDKYVRLQLVEHFVTRFTNKNTVVAAEPDPEDVTTEYEEAAYRKSFGIAEKTDLSASNTTEGIGNKASNQ